jgi:uncharacterized protein (TIGR02145 family)
MLRFYILLALPAPFLLGCGSYAEVSSFLAEECGKSYYDPKVQFCQDFEIYDKCGGSSYDPLNQKCENNRIFPKCGSSYYNQATQFCQNAKIYDKCGGYSYDPLNQKCENNRLFSKCGNEWYDSFSKFCTKEGNLIESKGEFIDSRDDRVYKYVAINTQIWMAENLRYETLNTKCYDDNPDNCKTYGILYDWNTAKTICPSGWHLPSDTEWFTLRNFATDVKLMANSVLWESGKGTDEFGFAALPGGYFRHEGYFLNIEKQAIFWSATAGTYAGSAHVHHITLQSGIRDIDGLYTDNSWVYVRCLKD